MERRALLHSEGDVEKASALARADRSVAGGASCRCLVGAEIVGTNRQGLSQG